MHDNLYKLYCPSYVKYKTICLHVEKDKCYRIRVVYLHYRKYNKQKILCIML
jgi:hypothetical protein